MEGELRSRRRRRPYQALAAGYALIGGAIATGLLFAGLAVGAFVAGLAVMLALAVATGLRSEASATVGFMMGYSFACAALSWPVLLVISGALWGKWQ